MRIIGGRFRGTKLAEVGEGDADAHLRPTADRTREAVFNMLTQGRFGDRVTGARVLDLFAGTGAMALEALMGFWAARAVGASRITRGSGETRPV